MSQMQVAFCSTWHVNSRDPIWISYVAKTSAALIDSRVLRTGLIRRLVRCFVVVCPAGGSQGASCASLSCLKLAMDSVAAAAHVVSEESRGAERHHPQAQQSQRCPRQSPLLATSWMPLELQMRMTQMCSRHIQKTQSNLFLVFSPRKLQVCKLLQLAAIGYQSTQAINVPSQTCACIAWTDMHGLQKVPDNIASV